MLYMYRYSHWSPFVSDSGPYISELLGRIEDEAVRQSVSDFLVPRSKLSVGDLIGKGTQAVAMSLCVVYWYHSVV